MSLLFCALNVITTNEHFPYGFCEYQERDAKIIMKIKHLILNLKIDLHSGLRILYFECDNNYCRLKFKK